MTIHYHCTPITPARTLESLAGRHFCVSYYRPDDVERCHRIGQSVMLDNGAYTTWKESGKRMDVPGFYRWAEKWLECPTTWAVIPDVIDGLEDSNDELVRAWPFGNRGAPVWHLNEPIERLIKLCFQFDRVCFGSAGEYYMVGSNAWSRRCRAAFDAMTIFPRMPWIHMLRGMALAGSKVFPFASLDSSDVGRNHKRVHNDPVEMAQKWDSLQCTMYWEGERKQLSIFDSGEERIQELEIENKKLTGRVMSLESQNRKLAGSPSYNPPTKDDPSKEE